MLGQKGVPWHNVSSSLVDSWADEHASRATKIDQKSEFQFASNTSSHSVLRGTVPLHASLSWSGSLWCHCILYLAVTLNPRPQEALLRHELAFPSYWATKSVSLTHCDQALYKSLALEWTSRGACGEDVEKDDSLPCWSLQTSFSQKDYIWSWK